MKSKKPVVKKTCPKCGREMSARGLNGHLLSCKGADLGSTKPLSPPAPEKPSNASFDMDAELLKEAGMQKTEEGTIEPYRPSIEELQEKHTVGYQAWAGLYWMAGQIIDDMVDQVKELYPDAKIKKSNVTQQKADHLGELSQQVFGPCDPKKALALEILGIFVPPCIGMILAVLPKEVTLKIFGGLVNQWNRMTSKLRPPEKPKEAQNGQANPAK